jgi:hypothetical protein
MNASHCPLCFTKLQVRDVAPCAECGHLPEEIAHALAGKHKYAEMRICNALTVILCDYCQVDFGSHDADFLGLSGKKRIGFGEMVFVRAIENIHIGKDKYCHQCGYRLAFLDFIARVRKLHATE